MTQYDPEAEVLPPSGAYIRTCMLCGKVTGEPLKVAGLLYKFCCAGHKEQWDLGRKTIRRMNQRQFDEDFE